MRSLEAIVDALAPVMGGRADASRAVPVHGGCINECYRLGTVFLKVAPSAQLAMFEAEAAGLEELHRARAVRVPQVIATGVADTEAYLALEWIDLVAASSATQEALGEQLARQHGATAQSFGWHRDNTIGSTPQINTQSADWVRFFREHRLRYQLDLARRKGHDGALQERGARLLERMDELFAGYRPIPSLVHGDLWGGNWGADSNGAPVIFDPAVYYGDREADIAMTRLFGGFGANFYRAYEGTWPLAAGAAERSTLYNLYHVLNHLNLFGRSYLTQAQSMIERLLGALDE